MKDTKKSPRITALKDISSYLEDYIGLKPGGKTDRFTITSYDLDTKKTRRLNRDLGLWSANKNAGNMARN
jgi:hypothetical protein